MELSRPALAVAVLVTALVVGPWLARVAVRLAARDDAALPTPWDTAVMTAGFAALLACAGELTGLRPATAALAWAAGAAVVLAATDLRAHRLPDRVTYPAYAVCGSALVVDAPCAERGGRCSPPSPPARRLSSSADSGGSSRRRASGWGT